MTDRDLLAVIETQRRLLNQVTRQRDTLTNALVDAIESKGSLVSDSAWRVMRDMHEAGVIYGGYARAVDEVARIEREIDAANP